MTKMLDKLSKSAVIMLACVSFICLCMVILGLIIIAFIYPFESVTKFIIGLGAGFILSVIKVISLDSSIKKAVTMEPKAADNYYKGQYIIRMVLSALIILLVLIFPNVFGIFGTIAGILSLQFASYLTNFVINKLNINLEK